MAEQKKQATKTPEKKEYIRPNQQEETLVRIAGRDILGSKSTLVGLTKIRGISWSIANAVCHILKLDRKKKVSELKKEEIQEIEKFIKNIPLKEFLKNRRFDRETGESKHKTGTDLEIAKDFDIRRMKKIRSYKGIRHTSGLPVRGQRTKSHFRSKGKSVGVKKREGAKKK